MPFTALEFIAKPAKAKNASLSYMRNGRSQKPGRKPSLVFSIPKSLLKGFKPKSSENFTFMVGSAKETGKGRIARTTGVGVGCTELKHAFVFRFGYVPMLGDDAADKEPVPCREIDNGAGLEIDLPPWFKAD